MFLITFTSLNAAEEECCSEEPCEKEPYLLIQGTIPGGAAAEVGMKEGDVIVSYDGTAVHCLKKLNMLKEAVETDNVNMVVKRGEETLTFAIPQGIIGVYLVEMLPDIDFSKEENAVVLEGVGPLDWSTGETNSYVAALTRIAEYLNLEYDYTYLMGASGSAFRVLFHKDWCPSSPDPTVGYDCGAVAAQCINIEPTYVHLDKEKKNKEEVQREIMEAVYSKMPVIAIDLIQVSEWGLIVGYHDKGEKLIVRDYFDRRQGYDIAEKFPWAIVTLDRKEGDIDDIKNFKHALKIAQELYETEMYNDYYSGIAALEYWIKRLAEDDFSTYDDKKLEEVILANAWIYQRCADDRMFGAKYLTSYAAKLPAVEKEILKLAALYEAEHKLLTSEENVAPYPQSFKTIKNWDSDLRQREIEILTRFLEKEREAHALIEEINRKLTG
jgi:hypothetical protein